MANRSKQLGLHFVVAFCAIAISFGSRIQPASAFDVESQAGSERSASEKRASHKQYANANALVSGEAPGVSKPVSSSARKPAAKGPFYVDFRARTAASYGHAFVWFGKSSERKVEVAGLHPAGDEGPYMLGHLIWVPSETGASYGDLDPQYLTANYRVYMSAADAQKVFAYIKNLQTTSPLWNAATTNCTAFIGKIATFMGLTVPNHLKRPEDYVNTLKQMNAGRQFVQLTSEPQLSVGQ